jgi:hypothetical protein
MNTSQFILDSLALLTPYDIPSIGKRRIGRRSDGGYVMFDDFDLVGPVYSFGIGHHASFEEDFAKRGKDVFMFDHTVEGPPVFHPNSHFFRHGLSAVDSPNEQVFSLQHHLERLGHANRSDMVLKIDIEGAEWRVLADVSEQVLGNFRQIVLEIHDLRRLTDANYRGLFVAALSKLNRSFTLGHVHGNNYARLTIVDGFVCADVIELSYLRSDIAETTSSCTVYPTQFDYANYSARPDHLLWFYPFLPLRGAVTNESFRASLDASRR